MRLLKLLFLSVVVFSILFFLLSFLFPSQVRVSRAASIRSSQHGVLLNLRDMRTWQQWNEMVQNPDLTGISVDSGKFQSDQLQINLKDEEPVRHIWRKNGIAIEGGFNLIRSAGDNIIVQWYMDFPLKWYPWEKFGSMLYDKQIGPVMERSLDKFKKLTEDSL
jgi:hypothetical protein